MELASNVINTVGKNLPTILDVGGSLLKASGTISAGKAQQANLNFQASQLEQQAGQTVAGATYAMQEPIRQGEYLASTALARAAASGGGASDPTIVNDIARINQEAHYRALVALYNGQEQAAGMMDQAQVLRNEGRAAKKAAKLKALPTILDAGTTLWDRYGPKTAPING